MQTPLKLVLIGEGVSPTDTDKKITKKETDVFQPGGGWVEGDYVMDLVRNYPSPVKDSSQVFQIIFAIILEISPVNNSKVFQIFWELFWNYQPPKPLHRSFKLFYSCFT